MANLKSKESEKHVFLYTPHTLVHTPDACLEATVTVTILLVIMANCSSDINSSQQTRTVTIRALPYSYLHLSLVSVVPRQDPIDYLTARNHLTSALEQFLGLTGAAIPIDFLKVEDQDIWIRVPREDGKAVQEAASSWVSDVVGWRVKGKSECLGALVAGNGRDLFRN